MATHVLSGPERSAREPPRAFRLNLRVGSVIGRIPIGPDEVALFFQGYGPTPLDWHALLYYRFRWVSGDLLEYGKRICLVEGASKGSTEYAIQRTLRVFEPGRAVDSADTAERRRPQRRRDRPDDT